MKKSLGFLILAGLLTACGGGGGGSSASGVAPNPGGATTQATQAQVTIIRPAAQSQARSAKFIPSTAQSIRVHVLSVNGATPDYNFFSDAIILLSTLNPACTTLANGGLSCTVKVKVPQSPGVVLQISAYNSTDGLGTPVATLTTAPIDTTQPNPVISASLGGIPASLVVSSPVITAPADGAKHSLSFNVTALDSSGNVIVGANYPTPITVSVTGDQNGALALGTPSIAGPGTPVTLTYDASKTLASATINLAINAAGSSPVTASVQMNPLIYSPPNLNTLFQAGASTSVTVSEAHYSGAFTLAGNGSNFTATCIPAGCTPATAGGTVSITIAPTLYGSGIFTVTDSYHTAASIPFVVTGQTGGGITVSNYKIIQYTPSSLPGAQLYGIAAGSDGKTLWYTDAANSAIGSIDTTTCSISTQQCGVVNEIPVKNSSVWAVTAGPDGNMYVSTSPKGSMGGFTQVVSSVSGCASAGSCAINFLAAYTTTARPSEMARDSSGTIYALDVASGAENLFRFGANPVAPISDGFASSTTANYGMIAAGPGPAPVLSAAARRAYRRPQLTGIALFTNIVWTDNSTSPSSLGFLVETCPSSCLAVQEYSLPFNAGALGGLASGANGMIYVIEQAANTIAIVSPSTCTSIAPFTCNVTQHIAIPTASAGAYDMTTGPDGNIWFTEPAVDKIGILNITTNQITEMPIPGGGAGVNGPKMITMGPDGNMWFTDYTSGKIGEVVL